MDDTDVGCAGQMSMRRRNFAVSRTGSTAQNAPGPTRARTRASGISRTPAEHLAFQGEMDPRTSARLIAQALRLVRAARPRRGGAPEDGGAAAEATEAHLAFGLSGVA